jgi:hypothetical protein
VILLISASQVARIIGVNHCAQCSLTPSLGNPGLLPLGIGKYKKKYYT